MATGGDATRAGDLYEYDTVITPSSIIRVQDAVLHSHIISVSAYLILRNHVNTIRNALPLSLIHI